MEKIFNQCHESCTGREIGLHFGRRIISLGLYIIEEFDGTNFSERIRSKTEKTTESREQSSLARANKMKNVKIGKKVDERNIRNLTAHQNKSEIKHGDSQKELPKIWQKKTFVRKSLSNWTKCWTRRTNAFQELWEIIWGISHRMQRIFVQVGYKLCVSFIRYVKSTVMI